MAISETTKIVVAQKREALKAKYDKNLKDIADLEAQVIAIKAANVVLKKDYDALKKDIPDPTVTATA